MLGHVMSGYFWLSHVWYGNVRLGLVMSGYFRKSHVSLGEDMLGQVTTR